MAPAVNRLRLELGLRGRNNRNHNPCVGGSNPSLATTDFIELFGATDDSTGKLVPDWY